MKTLKLAVAFSDLNAANRYAATAEGVLFSSTSESTRHLPLAALFVGATDDIQAALSAGDVGVYLVCERTLKNMPLSLLGEDELPAIAGLFAMVASSSLGPRQADIHWRDRHAPLALEIHTTMTHYYQLAVLHRFAGPDWNGIAVCCCASEEDLRHRFYNSREGEQRISEDVSHFADTRKSPRRVIANARRFQPDIVHRPGFSGDRFV